MKFTPSQVLDMANDCGLVGYGEDAGEYRIPAAAFHARMERLCTLAADRALEPQAARIAELEAEVERLRTPLTDDEIAKLVLQTVYAGDASTPHRDAWAREIGVPFARAIEAAKEAK